MVSKRDPKQLPGRAIGWIASIVLVAIWSVWQLSRELGDHPTSGVAAAPDQNGTDDGSVPDTAPPLRIPEDGAGADPRTVVAAAEAPVSALEAWTGGALVTVGKTPVTALETSTGFDVEVVRSDGSPIAGCFVAVATIAGKGWYQGGTARSAVVAGRVVRVDPSFVAGRTIRVDAWCSPRLTDSFGRTHVHVVADQLETAVELQALSFPAANRTDGAPELVSAKTRVVPPYAGKVVRLVAAEAAAVELRAQDTLGGALAGVHVLACPAIRVGGTMTVSASTGNDGVALLGSLFAGEWEVAATSPFAGSIQSVSVELAPGERRRIVVTFDAQDFEIAASGRVVDERGEPLAPSSMRWSVDDGATANAPASGDGLFTLWSRHGERVNIRFGLDLWSERFEPSGFDGPFGTKDLVFRRLSAPPRRTYVLHVVERDTERSIDDVRMLFSDGARSSWNVFDGTVAVDLPEEPALGIAIFARGYRDMETTLQSLPRADDSDCTLRVELDPGFRRTIRVLQCASLTAIEGARIAHEDRIVAVSDAEGRALVDLTEWPRHLTIEREGYERAKWNPTQRGEGYAPREILLNRAP